MLLSVFPGLQKLHGELEAAVHLNSEAKVAEMRDNITSNRRRAASYDSVIPFIMFRGQGRCINHPPKKMRPSFM